MASRRRHISPLHEQYGAKTIEKDEKVLGIEISGYRICTHQGSIADEHTMNKWTDTLQDKAQSSSAKKTIRRLCLPEMVFANAYLKIKCCCSSGATIQFNAFEALQEWAVAHQEIQLEEEHRGVSVLKSVDAELWMTKKSTHVAACNGSSVFHYDWTFSTPHAGSVVASSGEADPSSFLQWHFLDSSGMPMHLLRDQSVPILLFDEIVLYEDDLHDNGEISLVCKVRVMPTCVFLLQRLWLRVDGVLIRTRDVRVMVEFSTNKMYRDIVWRECPWEDLEKHGLPSDVRAWRHAEQDVNNPAAFQAMLQRLPTVSLPSDLHAHAVLQIKQGEEEVLNDSS